MSNSLLSQSAMGTNCCCGSWTQLFFPNLDFEDGPDPPPGGFIVYGTGAVFGGWTVTRATIDHVEATHAGLGNGNPNGASNFVDLHGSPGFGAISYKLNNLKPGASYRIEFWTAQNGGNHSSTGTLKIAGGAWLNESWTVSISGAVLWFKVSYMFMAMSDMADMEFSSVGDLAYAGTLIDDIAIFECPGDTEAPKVVNEPMDEEYSCIENVPKAAKLDVTDDCDLNPIIKFTEKVNKKDECETVIERKWEISDHCNNTTSLSQQISVIDREPPILTNPGTDKLIFCKQYNKAQFTNWLNAHGGISATDNCKEVFWEYSFDKIPEYGCDTSIVAFTAKDHCGNETIKYLNFIIRDTSKPILVQNASHSLLRCSSTAKDSLKKWLISHAGIDAIDSCSLLSWTNNFNGDSSSLRIMVDFIAEDQCGNKLVVPAIFEQLDAPDTSYNTSYNCHSKFSVKDTIYYSLPGCDSVVILNEIGIQVDTTYFQKITCDPFQKNDTIHFQSKLQCDSIVLISYTWIPSDTIYVREDICGLADTIIETNRLQGTYCDSFIIKISFPKKIHRDSLIRYTCDSTQVGSVEEQFINIFGCDSIVVLETKFNPVSIYQRDSLVCGLKKSFADTLIFKTTSCDSIQIINYFGLKEDSSFLHSFTCNPQDTGISITRLTNNRNCDSIIIEYKSLIPTPITILRSNSCNPLQKAIDTVLLQAASGCDSIVLTYFSIHIPDTSYFNQRTCDTNHILKTISKFKGQYCDSVVITNYTIVKSILETRKYKTCFADSVRSDTLRLFSSDQCDSLIVTQYEYNPVSFEFEKTDNSCFEESDGKLKITKILNASPPLTTFLDDISFNSRFIFDSLKVGKHSLYVLDNLGCPSDTIEFNIKAAQPITIDIGSDLTLSRPEIVSFFERSAKLFSTYLWNPASLFECASCPRTNAYIEQDTTVYLIVQDEHGCIASDTLHIRLAATGDIFVPNIFSPNNDLVNDRFYPMGSDLIKINWMRIYDRWGALVFEKYSPQINHPEDGWDGTFNSKLLLPAPYIYVLSYVTSDQRSSFLTGDLSLIR